MRGLPQLIAVFSLLGLLVGCGRPANPLDWKIEASTPRKYNDWNEATTPYLPSDLRDEFNHVWREFVIVSGRAGQARSMEDSSDPICRRINGRTIRQALQTGYELEKGRLNRKIDLDGQLLLHALQQAESDDGSPAAKRRTATIATQRREIEEAKQRIEAIDARLAQLEKAQAPQR